MMPHLLLVEDDPAIATSLRITFKREGWTMTWLDNASAVLPTLLQLNHTGQLNQTDATASVRPEHADQPVDVAPPLSAIILDVGLPDGDGLNLCQQIRHHQGLGHLASLPIVFLTARSDEIDRILGLEMGADDYCAKPFSPRELVARLKAIWRREQLLTQQQSQPDSKGINSDGIDGQTSDNMTSNRSASTHPTQPPQTQTQTQIQLQAQAQTEAQAQLFQLASGHWRYQPNNYQLYWQGEKLPISNTERLLLLTLLNAPTQVFSREQLLAAISDYPDHRLARTIDSHIKSIRKQLALIDECEVIYTHRGIGYGLCPP